MESLASRGRTVRSTPARLWRDPETDRLKLAMNATKNHEPGGNQRTIPLGECELENRHDLAIVRCCRGYGAWCADGDLRILKAFYRGRTVRACDPAEYDAIPAAV